MMTDLSFLGNPNLTYYDIARLFAMQKACEITKITVTPKSENKLEFFATNSGLGNGEYAYFFKNKKDKYVCIGFNFPNECEHYILRKEYDLEPHELIARHEDNISLRQKVTALEWREENHESQIIEELIVNYHKIYDALCRPK